MKLAPGHETRLETEPAELIKVMRRPRAKVVCSCGWKAPEYRHRSALDQDLDAHRAQIAGQAVSA